MDLCKQEPRFINLTLFTTALCNLNCSYCYICKDKAGGLQYIDEDIKNDFLQNKQIQQVLDFDPTIKDSLTEITLWGGEPFLHMERFLNKIEDYFQAFPHINMIGTSTNFTVPNTFESLQLLLDKVNILYKGEKKFKVSVQISIDGYPEMNDFGRGQGVTEKFLNNFKKMFDLKYNFEKIELEFYTKPTLSKNTFHFLDTEEKCIKWFKFFDEELFQPHQKSKCKWSYGNALFNCAAPTEWTKDDGINYAKISRNIQHIQEEVKNKYSSWKVFDSLVPEANHAINMLKGCRYNISEYVKTCRSGRCGGGCGSFIYTIVPITNGKFTMCHRGLFDAYADYFENMSSKDYMNGLSSLYFKAQNVVDWIYTPEEFRTMNNSMKKLDMGNHNIFYTDLVNDIREYAFAGIIDEKYTELSILEETLGYFLNNSICLQDGYIFTGTWTGRAPNEIPLLYNGTMDVVQEELIRAKKEKGVDYDLSRAIK